MGGWVGGWPSSYVHSHSRCPHRHACHACHAHHAPGPRGCLVRVIRPSPSHTPSHRSRMGSLVATGLGERGAGQRPDRETVRGCVRTTVWVGGSPCRAVAPDEPPQKQRNVHISCDPHPLHVNQLSCHPLLCARGLEKSEGASTEPIPVQVQGISLQRPPLPPQQRRALRRR